MGIILIRISIFLEIWLTSCSHFLTVLFMMIDYETAASLFSQLGNQTRLKIVRELVRAGRTGMAVGEIQKKLGTPHSTLSHHINHLRNVGLIKQTRESTVLRCFIEYRKIEAIVTFLTEECCVADIKSRS
jgi:DNA-binding transcriptional ArsR family regulator